MKKISLVFLMIFALGCSHRIRKTKINDFEYFNGKQRLILEIMTGDNYLRFDTPTKIKVKFDNIIGENLSFSGRGIQFFKNIENEIILEVNLKKIENDLNNFPLVVYYKADEVTFLHKFVIPVK